jgi:aldose 1-epimerase
MRIYHSILSIVLALSLLATFGGAARAAMIIDKEPFGETGAGLPVDLYTLTNSNGVAVQITNYEGIVVSIIVPDAQGEPEDIVLGYSSLQDYLDYDPYLGGIRDKSTQRLNDIIWDAEEFKNDEGIGLKLQTEVPAENGGDGLLAVHVTYTLTNKNELKIEYSAMSSVESQIDLTNDIYFNLGGADSGDVLDHEILINSEGYYPYETETMRPVNQVQTAAGTPMNYTEPRSIGAGMEREGEGQERVQAMRGYRHIWHLNTENKDTPPLPLAARIFDPETKRVLEVRTTTSGMWFETGNFMDKTLVGKDDTAYGIHAGFTLAARETELSRKTLHFPAVKLVPDEMYAHTIIYKFFTL